MIEFQSRDVFLDRALVVARAVGVIVGCSVMGSACLAQDGGTVYEDFKIVSSETSRAQQLGQSVAIDDGVVAVGMWLDDHVAEDAGSINLFNLNSGDQTSKFYASDGSVRDRFGTTVAMEDGILVVGAPFDDTRADGGVNDFGALYVFDIEAGVQVKKITLSSTRFRDYLGSDLAMGGGLIVAGVGGEEPSGHPVGFNSGAVYIYDASTGEQVSVLLPEEPVSLGYFGNSVAIHGGVVAVGARRGERYGPGVAYLYDALTGQKILELVPSDGAEDKGFAGSIAINDKYVLVGAHYDDVFGSRSGSAYLFDRETGEQVMKLLPDTAFKENKFGSTVALGKQVAVVGMLFTHEAEINSGAAFVFDLATGEQMARLVPSDGVEQDFFSLDLEIERGVVVVGARGAGAVGSNLGAVYVYDLGLACKADLNDDGRINGRDVRVFIQYMLAQDPRADLNGDGIVTIADLLEFVHSFQGGC